MARSGDIVANGLRRVATQKNRAGVANFIRQSIGLRDGKFEVFRGNSVDERRRPVQRLQ